MQRKIFWVMFLGGSLLLDFSLPLLWGFILTIPLIVACWWVAYRSGWFE